jgi:hypothetical protein
MMRTAGLLGAAIGTLVLTAVLASQGGAQPYSPQDLAKRGDDYWDSGQCFDAAMNYYALLQQPPRVLGTQVIGRLRDRIGRCRTATVGVGQAGVRGKADGGGQPIDGDRSPTVLPPMPPSPAANAQNTGPAIATVGTVERPDSAETPRVRACRAYAETAVAQTQMLRARRCDPQGLRTWSPDYAFHYGWCTQRAAPLAAQNEATNRARVLNGCILSW